MTYLFKKKSNQSDDSKVIKYDPLMDIYILSFNLETQKIGYKRILEFSVHKDVKMYKIEHRYHQSFETFWASSDHSLVVYDSKIDQYRRVSPEMLLADKDYTENHLFFVKLECDFKKYFPEEYDHIQPIIPLEDKNNYKPITSLTLLPITDEFISITHDPSITTAYDFTVEDNYTFTTHDGICVFDTMAVYYVPYHKTLDRLHVTKNLINPASLKPLPTFSHEFVLCLYQMTKDDPDPNSPDARLDLKTPDEVRKNITPCHKNWHITIYDFDDPTNSSYTTFGRWYVSSLLPPQYKITFPLDKKAVTELVRKMIWELPTNQFKEHIENLLQQVKYARATLSLEDFEQVHTTLQEQKQTELVSLLDKDKPTTVSNPQQLNDFLTNLNKLVDEAKQIAPEDITNIIESGASGTWQQLQQMAICKGVVSDTSNRVVGIIPHSLLEGLTDDEMFLSTYGTRKGLIDKGVETSVTGYTARQLVYALANEIHDPNNPYCGTTKYLVVKITKQNCKLFLYRYIVNPIDPKNGKPILLTSKNIHKFIDKKVALYSPIFCKSKHICKRCFGNLYPLLKSRYVGVISAQAISERTTQLTLRTFHTSGTVEKLSKEGSNVDVTTHMDEFKRILTNRKLSVLESYHRMMEIFSQYNLLSIWIEILCRRLYVDPDTWEVAALKGYDGKVLRVSLKEAVTCNGWLHGLAFENAIKHLKLGLYEKYETKAESIFEQLILSV